MIKFKSACVLALLMFCGICIAQENGPTTRPDTKWFTDAKFGIFMHWGLYSQAGNEWNGKNYYGSGEWLMNRTKASIADYEKLAANFNPVNFNADEWAKFVRDSGAKYLVITAKHHEGFAMFGSKVSPYNIVDATPYKQDPMKPLAEACRQQGIRFGFYYSQFLDWHEPNGGGNSWDFKGEKDVKKYYAEKSMPQIKELLSNYGPLGIIWFDMPGGLSHEETLAFMSDVRKLQPQCLISSRVGQGLGDFKDLGDSELPPDVVDGPWEALFTHTDSWGFVKTDANFKTPREVIRLLVSTSARGGNLLLNVGPDGTGKIPETSQRYLREVGKWLGVNGESVYGTTHSPLPDQPWGVMTSKPGKLYLHVLQKPENGIVYLPRFEGQVQHAHLLNSSDELQAKKDGDALLVTLPHNLADSYDNVIVVEYSGSLSDSWHGVPSVISRQFDSLPIEAARATVSGNAKLKSETSARYFGNWKHDTCVIDMQSPEDKADFATRFIEPGDYRITLEYACPVESKAREGAVEFNGRKLLFETLVSGAYDNHEPIMFVKHAIGIVTVDKPSETTISVHPLNAGTPLLWLRRVILEPVK